jgi:hypothetical protein
MVDSAQAPTILEQVQTLLEQSQRSTSLQQLVSLLLKHKELSRLPEVREVATRTPVANLPVLLRTKGLISARLQPVVAPEKVVAYREEEEEEPTDVTYAAFEVKLRQDED